MSVKRHLGDVLVNLGFVTKDQIEVALRKQRSKLEEDYIPERVSRDKLIAEARMAAQTEAVSMLGQILTDMGFVNQDQLEIALSEQRNEVVQRYRQFDIDKLVSVLEISTAINSTLNLAEVLALIMAHASKITHSIACSLMLLDEQTGELVFSVPTGMEADKLVDIRVPAGQGIAGWVVQNEKYVLVPNAQNDPRFYTKIDEISGLKTESLLCVPLKAKQKLIGVLEAINKVDGTPFSEEDAHLLSVFASHAAMSIENARLYGELRDLLEEERKMKRELASLEKFRAIGQMASGISHDFNNILAAVTGHAEMAMFSLPDDSPVKENIEQISKAGQLAGNLVRQILTFSRESEPERVPVQLTPIVKEVLKLMRASISETIEIRENFQAHNDTVLADPTQLNQVVMNLCNNAAHAMKDKGGIIEVSLCTIDNSNTKRSGRSDRSGLGSRPGRSDRSGRDDMGEHYGNELQDISYLRLSVKDTGHGMDADTVERIFDPYFTTKKKGIGTGLGLAVTHGIVKNHDGIIKVNSTPEEGTTFHIHLPCL